MLLINIPCVGLGVLASIKILCFFNWFDHLCNYKFNKSRYFQVIKVKKRIRIMGQGYGVQENYNEEELLRQLAETDPTFRYTDYVDGNCTLQEVISIRQCFLDLRG